MAAKEKAYNCGPWILNHLEKLIPNACICLTGAYISLVYQFAEQKMLFAYPSTKLVNVTVVHVTVCIVYLKSHSSDQTETNDTTSIPIQRSKLVALHRSWAAWYITRLLIMIVPKGVVFSFFFFGSRLILRNPHSHLHVHKTYWRSLQLVTTRFWHEVISS